MYALLRMGINAGFASTDCMSKIGVGTTRKAKEKGKKDKEEKIEEKKIEEKENI